MKEFLVKYAHWLVLGVASIWTVLETLPPTASSGGIDLNEFGKLPVRAGGRIKPLDSLARSSLLLISNEQSFVDQNGHKQPAIRWLIDVMASVDPMNGPAAKHQVFRIENDQVLNMLNLPKRPGVYRYSFAEISPSLSKLQQAYSRAQAMESKKRDIYENKVLELGDRLMQYGALVDRSVPQLVPPQSDRDEWTPLDQIERLVYQHFAQPLLPQAEERARENLAEKMKKMGLDIGTLGPERKEAVDALVRRDAHDLLKSAFEERRAEELERYSPAAATFVRILDAYRDGKADRFHNLIEEYRTKYLGGVGEASIAAVDREAFLNQFRPFVVCGFLYLCVCALSAIGWLAWPETLRRSAFWLCALTLAIQSYALVSRMVIMDRPLVLVTNLYSSAVVISWGCVGIGLVLEVIFRNSVGVTSGAVLGALSNLIAHNYLAGSGSGDTLEMMQAVLDTNFWLATHVTTVVFGYVATLVAGALGIFFIVAGMFTEFLDRTRTRTLTSMIYGIVCFATLLSFTGTVLGGIWADQSWGRFWGWDPKENGAVLVVIWNALILHARWGGMIKQRGLAVMTLVGIMITFWSWFGTNQLGVGLHAYGFSNKLANLCCWIWVSILGLIGIGLVPLRFWASFRERPELQPPSKSNPGKAHRHPAKA